MANQMGAAPMLITPHRTRTIAAAVDVVELELLAFLRGILEEVRFALDSPLEGQSRANPSLEPEFPASWENTGNFWRLAPSLPPHRSKGHDMSKASWRIP